VQPAAKSTVNPFDDTPPPVDDAAKRKAEEAAAVRHAANAVPTRCDALQHVVEI
jgi:hypothetical protein